MPSGRRASSRTTRPRTALLFFACGVHTHLLADDRSPQLAAAATFLGLAATPLTLDLLAT